MQEKLKSRFKPLLEKWNELEKNQQIKLVGGSIIVLASIILFVYIMTRPTMVTLIDNVEYTTIVEAEQALQSEGIPSTITRDSKGIEVREEDHSRAKLVLSQNTNISSDKFTFNDALDVSSFGMTEDYRRQALIEAEQSKMETTLESLDKVNTADVKLSIPNSSDFIFNEGRKPSASIVLGLNSALDSQQSRGIARFISTSVMDLEVENVTILDQDSNLIFGGSLETNVTSEMEERSIVERNRIINSVENILSPLYDYVAVSPSVEINWNEQQSQLEIFTPYGDTSTGIVAHEISESSEVENQSTGNEVGLGANDNANTTYQVNGGGNSSANTDYNEKTYNVNREVTTTTVAPGSIDKLNSSVSVIVYDEVIYDEKYMMDNNLLEDITWREFKESVQNEMIEIDENMITLVEGASGLGNVNMVGYTIPRFVDYEPIPVNVQEVIIFVVLALLILMLAFVIIRNTRIEEVEEIEPELSVQDLLVSTQIEEEKEQLAAIELREEDEKKQQISNFVTDKPETAAQLLRNWLNEEWEDM